MSVLIVGKYFVPVQTWIRKESTVLPRKAVLCISILDSMNNFMSIPGIQSVLKKTIVTKLLLLLNAKFVCPALESGAENPKLPNGFQLSILKAQKRVGWGR